MSTGSHRAGKTLGVLFHPVRGITGESVFPTGKPKKYEMKTLRAGLFDPMIQNRKIELALNRLQLVPCDGHQHGVDVRAGEPRQNAIRLGGGSGGGIAQFAAENDERPAVHDQLRGGRPAIEVRNFLPGGVRRVPVLQQ